VVYLWSRVCEAALLDGLVSEPFSFPVARNDVYLQAPSRINFLYSEGDL
jgi:hypothetical protein